MSRCRCKGFYFCDECERIIDEVPEDDEDEEMPEWLDDDDE